MTGETPNSKSFLEDSFLEGPVFTGFVLGTFVIAGVILIATADGTGDGGDSVMHYQFARFAFVHHQLFFHHWAKPMFVLLASPFAQFGFAGMKVFNLSVSTVTLFLTWLVARQLKIKRNALAPLFMLMSPAFAMIALSGLTEPLFALLLMLSVYLYQKDKIIWAIIAISFLPFVRSEGLIMCGVFGLLLLFEKRYLIMPLLATGHLAYGIAGYPVHKSFFWTITAIPYGRLSSAYGKGGWLDFFFHLPEIIGIPLYVLLVAGLLAGIAYVVKSRAVKSNLREALLIYGCFLAYFSGHVIFWALGIFNSMGLLRVLIGILPLMAIIELRGFNLVDLISLRPIRVTAVVALVLSVLIFPFSKSDFAWNYKRDFCLGVGQTTLEDLGAYVKATYPQYASFNYFFDSNYAAVALNLDFFDDWKCRRTRDTHEVNPKHALLIWDEYYSKFEEQSPLDSVKNDQRFVFVRKFSAKDLWGSEYSVFLFKTKDI